MKKLYGVTVAMVTPFTKDNEVCYRGIEQLTDMLIEKGVNCLYPCGTTGEMLRLSTQERMKIAETVVKRAAGRVTVYIHCGANNQEDTVALLKHAEKIGADGAGVVTPSFFALEDREMEAYYVEVAGSVSGDFPIYLYNIPQCAGNDIKPNVAAMIAQRCPNVIGIKYSYADLNRTVDYLKIEDFDVMHGCDRLFISLLVLGCSGVVSGVAGVFPEPFVAAYKAYNEGKLAEAQKLQKICVKFCDALRCGVNMSYYKEALKMRGIDAGYMRKPQLDLPMKDVEELRSMLVNICNEAGIDLRV
ncbi:MAG: dihydrodipicolinate synthase family protein [Bacillota bacterium]